MLCQSYIYMRGRVMHMCKFCGKKTDSKKGNSYHENRCNENPNKVSPKPKSERWRQAMLEMRGRGVNQFTKHGDSWEIRESTREKLRKASKGRRHSKDAKKKISESMKQAHAEGRAWNIGQSRWNNEPSWPEKFFMEVIENEFFDKDYSREYPLSIYSCDFAWPHKKKCIEIDGEQHRRFQEVIDRDARKDKKLKSEGWEILRISWKEFCKDTKKWIELSNRFIGE